MQFLLKLVILVAALILLPSPALGQSNSNPPVKKSAASICHEKGSTYYSCTEYFTPYQSIGACLDSGGRLPKVGVGLMEEGTAGGGD